MDGEGGRAGRYDIRYAQKHRIAIIGGKDLGSDVQIDLPY